MDAIKLKPVPCPLDGTSIDGYCVDHVATITVATGECDHMEECAKLRQQNLEEKYEDKRSD